ncbi:MAG: transporter substrate-binding domain-containing protein [Nibricoccus sp.]
MRFHSNSIPAFSPSFRWRFLCAVIGVVLFCATTSRSDDSDFNNPQRFEKAITVGTPTDSYPFSYQTDGRHCEGFAVDLLEATARVMSIRIKRVQAPSSRLAEMLQNGEVDMLQSLSPGPGREKFADFSVHYMELQGSYLVRSNDTRFQTPFDLHNAEVAIPGYGSIGEQFLRDNGISAHLVHTHSVEESLTELNAGLHDAAFAARLTALSFIERDNLQNIRPLGQPLVGYNIRYCYAVRKGDAILLARLNEGLAILSRTGEYDTIYRKWFGRFEAPLITRERVVSYVASALALALVVTVFALLRQRALRKRLARQSRQIAENEAILAEAQHIANLGNWRYELKTRVLECSTETLRILGRNPNRPPPSYFRLLMMMPRAERSLVHRAIRNSLQDGIACDVTIPLRIGPANVRILHATARPTRNASGQIVSLFGTVQDITRQKTAEEGLRAREQLLRALYDNVPTAMGVVEEAGASFRFISANPGTARILGVQSGSVAGRILAELSLPPQVIEFWTRWLRQGIEQSDIYKTEYYYEAARRHYAVTLVPLGGDESSLRQLCFLVDDITERKEIDTEIAQGRRLRAIGELVGGIAHEFNNLLTPIMLKTELLASEWAKNPRLLEEIQTIAKASKRGADLTRRLLTLGRRTESRREEIQLNQIVRANFDLLQPTIDRRITLRMNIPEGLPPLFLNPSELHQIILNLLLNARDTLVEKLSHPGSPDYEACITVSAENPDTSPSDSHSPFGVRPPLRWVRLVVRDNGMGMPAEVQERIFEPFYTTKEVGKGTGLGLATVWHLVNRLGGKINVESKPGEGSAFFVWLPVNPGGPSAQPTRPPIDTLVQKTTANILLAEDDDLVARTVIAVLRRMGHQVVHFANGNDAWQHLTANQGHDILLLDLDLPGISGLEIARRVRSTNYPGRIMIASGRLTEEEVRELDALNVNVKLQKPFTPKNLGAAIEACLGGKT